MHFIFKIKYTGVYTVCNMPLHLTLDISPESVHDVSMNGISSVQKSGLAEQAKPKDFEFNVVLKWKDIPDQGHCQNWTEWWDDNGKRKQWQTAETDMLTMDTYIEEIYTHFKDKPWSIEDDEYPAQEFKEVLEYLENNLWDPVLYERDVIDLGRWVYLIGAYEIFIKELFKNADDSLLLDINDQKNYEQCILYAKQAAMEMWASLPMHKTS